ncbi:MAG TPA: hydrogenase maturation nickel metallochaperone HypA [Acidothermaceae bacterium]|jgi:hydrogenase nickel incorporation protein HypA/HybF|nr:hydrogenase maturation nickel metallochaperone HypA [Acidothermaceae bacterium]
MHELSICGSVADIATRRAGGRSVEAIHLRIGQLRQIVPDTLEYCWSMVTTSTELEGSRLEIDYVRARIRCRTCGAVHELDEYPILLCTTCEGADVEILAGEEFLVTALDLVQV